MSTVLVQLPSGQGVVSGDDGSIVLTRDVADPHGQRLAPEDYRPARDRLDARRSLVGGLLPARAVSVEVTDDAGIRVPAVVGAGAYVAILEQPNRGDTPVVCCRDAAGHPVLRPLPAEWSRTEVMDADVPCPACGAVAYDEVVPTDHSRGGRGGPGHDGPLEPSHITVCRVCGHEEGAGVGVFGSHGASGRRPDGSPIAQGVGARERSRPDVVKWYADSLTLRAVEFPIYAVENWDVTITGTGGVAPGPVDYLTLTHHRPSDTASRAEPLSLRVRTGTGRDQPGGIERARRTLETGFPGGSHPWPEVSEPALKLWLGVRQRERRAAVFGAVETEQLITIDGTPEPFLMLTSPKGQWVAVRHHGGLTITIAAVGLDPDTLALNPLSDPAARLLGRAPDDA